MIALILGCAENVWTDTIDALSMCSPDAIFAVKDMMAQFPGRIDYGATLHPERTAGYMRDRRRRGLATDFQVYAHRNTTPEHTHKTLNDWAGSSGLFAVRIARELGFEAIVLAGVPMDKKYGHISRHKDWPAAKIFHNGWIKREKEIAPYVRSMSGWTKEVFGRPTLEWLSQHGSTDPDHRIIELVKAVAERHDAAFA